MRPGRAASAILVLLIAALLVLVACSDPTSGAPEPTTAAGQRGLVLAGNNGCLGCHTTTGPRNVGPTWKDLYGSERKLTDGTTVIADEEYLTTAITDPGAQVVEGYGSVMPENRLSDDEVADVIAYLRELAPEDS